MTDLRANLSLANLQKADLRAADLTNANLMSANLEGANLTGANLTCAVMARARVRGMIDSAGRQAQPVVAGTASSKESRPWWQFWG
jgi:uncharacterized protein YjbI with pentapeptide repeats